MTIANTGPTTAPAIHALLFAEGVGDGTADSSNDVVEATPVDCGGGTADGRVDDIVVRGNVVVIDGMAVVGRVVVIGASDVGWNVDIGGIVVVCRNVGGIDRKDDICLSAKAAPIGGVGLWNSKTGRLCKI